jgi:hypothetical protein
MELVEHTTPQQQPQSEATQERALSAEERKHYEYFLSGIRKNSRRSALSYRRELLNECLAELATKESAEGLWVHHQELLRLVEPLAHVSRPSAKATGMALETVLHETDAAMTAVEQLQEMEAEIRGAVDRLEPKTRAVAGILARLSHIESLSVDVDFGQSIGEELEADNAIDANVAQAKDDSELAVLRDAFELVRQIEDATL